MKGDIFNPGQPQKREVFDHNQDSHEEAIRERQLDLMSPGILRDSALNGESIPFAVEPDTGLTVKVGTGVALAPHNPALAMADAIDASDASKTGCERTVVPVADVAVGKNYQRSAGSGPGTGTGTGPFQESSDGLGGWVSTPQSTLTRNIPLVNGVMNWVWISYQSTIDLSVSPAQHKVLTSKLLYWPRLDGYDIVVTQTSSLPGGDPRYEFLATVDLTGSPGSVTPSMISTAGRRYAAIRTKRVNLQLDSAALKPASVSDPSVMSLEDHANCLGTGTLTPNNVHALGLVDLGITQDIDLRSHRIKDHTNGLVVPAEASTSSAMYPRTDTSTPVSGDAAMVYMKKLTTNETILVDGSVYGDAGIDSAVKLTVPIGSASAGDYYVSFGTANSSGVYGIVFKQVGTSLTVEKRSSPFTLDPSTDYLVCLVQWDGTQFILPSPPNVQTDSRVFGTIARRNLQKGSADSNVILDGAVTEPKLASNAVTTTKILDLNVTESKINNGAVTNSKLADNSVSTAKLQDNSANSQKIAPADGTSGQSLTTGEGIKTGHIQDDALTSQKIAEWDGSSGPNTTNTGSGIATDHIKDEAVTQDKLDPGVVTFLASIVGNGLKSRLTVSSTSNSTLNAQAAVLSVQGVVLTGVNVTADIAISGAGGLDSGSESSLTWYAVHVICHSDGTGVNSLLSLSASAPTAPSGYNGATPSTDFKFRRVGWVRNDGSSNFVQFDQMDSDVMYRNPGFSAQAFGDGYSASVPFANYIPATSQIGEFSAMCSGVNGGGFTTYVGITVRPTGSGATYTPLIYHNLNDGGHSQTTGGRGRCLLDSSRNMDIIVYATSSSSTMYVNGYKDSI